jgi:hypothetical protein
MRLRDQLLGAVVLCAATWFCLLRIAEAKNERSVGSAAYSLAAGHSQEREAFDDLRGRLEGLGQQGFSARLDELRRRLALLEPRAHLAEQGPPEGSPEQQQLFAWLGLCGALRHELAHHDGLLDEAAAYARELAWYEELRGSPFVKGLEGRDADAWRWALDSALLSAREAARREESR